MDLAKTANTNSLAEVDVSGDRGGTNVEPIDGLRWKLLGRASLDGINPTWYYILAEVPEDSGRRGVRTRNWQFSLDRISKS